MSDGGSKVDPVTTRFYPIDISNSLITDWVPSETTMNICFIEVNTFPKSIMSQIKFSKWTPFSRWPPKNYLLHLSLG